MAGAISAGENKRQCKLVHPPPRLRRSDPEEQRFGILWIGVVLFHSAKPLARKHYRRAGGRPQERFRALQDDRGKANVKISVKARSTSRPRSTSKAAGGGARSTIAPRIVPTSLRRRGKNQRQNQGQRSKASCSRAEPRVAVFRGWSSVGVAARWLSRCRSCRPLDGFRKCCRTSDQDVAP